MILRRKNSWEGPDLQIEHEVGPLIAVSESPKNVGPSYPLVEPVQWYVKAELLRYFDEEKQIGDKPNEQPNPR